MKKVLVVLMVLSLLVIGLGFSRGWFALSSPNADRESNQINVNLSVDRDKMQEDAETVKHKTAELTSNVTGRERQPNEQMTDKVESK